MTLMQPVALDAMLATLDQFTRQFDELVQSAEQIAAWSQANLTAANQQATPPLLTDVAGAAITAAQLAELQTRFTNVGKFATWAKSPFSAGAPTPLDYFRSIARVVR